MIKSSRPGNSPSGIAAADPSDSAMSELVVGSAVIAQVLPGGQPALESEIKSTVRATDREARLRWMVDQYLDFVARVLRNLPARPRQKSIDDSATHLHRRRPSARRRSPRRRTQLPYCRLALYVAAQLPPHPGSPAWESPAELASEQIDQALTPEQLTDQKRARKMLDRVLSEMDGDLRTVFVLYEFRRAQHGGDCRRAFHPSWDGGVATSTRSGRFP